MHTPPSLWFARATALAALAAALAACGPSAEPPDAPSADAPSEMAPDVSPDVSPDLAEIDLAEIGPDASQDVPFDASEVSLGPAVLTVDRAALAFGDWECGAPAPAEQTLTITNEGPSEGAYEVTLSDGWFAAIGPTSGALRPGERATVRVAARVPLTPVAPTRAGADIIDRLDVVPLGRATGGRTVELRVVRHGAELVGGGPEDFVSDTAAMPISRPTHAIRNQGDRPVILRFNRSLHPSFTFSVDGESSESVTLSPGQSVNPTVRYAPTGSGAQSGAVRATASGVVCADASAPWTLSGRSSSGEILVSGDLDFGAVGCGQTGAAQTVVLSNPGATTASFAAALLAGAESRYRISPASGSLPPRGTATVTVTPLALDATVALPRAYREELQITSASLPTEGRTVVLRREAFGAVLRWRSAAPTQTLRTIPGTAASAEFQLDNAGSAPAVVAFSTSVGARLQLDPAAPVTLPPGASVTVRATWRPTTDDSTGFSTVLRVATDSPLCEPLPDVAPGLSSEVASGGLIVGASQIDFVDLTLCAETPPARYVPLTNTANVPISVLLGATTPFTVFDNGAAVSATTPVTIAPRATRVIEVRAPALTNPLATRVGELDVLPSPDSLVPVPRTALRIAQNTRRAEIIPNTATNLGDTLAVGFERRSPFTLYNHGNAPARMTVRNLTTGQTAELNVPAAISSTPGNAAVDLTRVVPAGAFTETVEVSFLGSGTDPTCGAAPRTLQIRGTGTTGGLSLTASTLDFGDNFCRQERPNAQTLLITNNTGSARAWTVVVDSPTPQFELFSSGPFMLPAGARLAISVRPRTATMLAPGEIRQSLLFRSAGIPDQRVELFETIRGATVRAVGNPLILAPQPVRGTEGSVSPAGAGWTTAFVMDGNARLNPRLVFSGNDRREWVSTALLTEAPTVFHGVYQVGSDPAEAGLRTSTLTVDFPFSDPLCGAVPSPVMVRGEGSTGARLTSTPSRVYFGMIACGATPEPRVITLRNPAASSAPFSIRLPVGSRFAVSPMSGTIAAGGAASLTVSSAPAPQSYQPASATAGAYFRDDLSGAFTVVSGANELPVEVEETAYGNAYVFNSARSTLFGTYSASLTRTEPLPGFAGAYDLQADYSGSCSRISEVVDGLSESHLATCDASRAGTIAFRVVGSTLVGSCSPIGVRQMYATP